jgi:hypothetical protein
MDEYLNNKHGDEMKLAISWDNAAKEMVATMVPAWLPTSAPSTTMRSRIGYTTPDSMLDDA